MLTPHNIFFVLRYCYECLNKATGERNCIVCGKKTGRNLVYCDNCPRIYHTDCLTPQLNKVSKYFRNLVIIGCIYNFV